MRLLAFSDVHTDLSAAADLVAPADDVDVVIGAGDFASIHRGLGETIDALAAIETPTLLVPGNNETEDELRDAAAGWEAATVLHGDGTELDGVAFWGLGAGVPVTPWDWSFDLSEEEAAPMLAGCPDGAVLIVHSPPLGYVDQNGAGEHLGSKTILRAIEDRHPRLAVCGHIHESWGREARVGTTKVVNLGPDGVILDV